MRTGVTSLAVKPLQPWFVINAAEDYLKKAVSNSPIAHFYRFSVAREQPVTLAVPDGSVDILFHINRAAPVVRLNALSVRRFSGLLRAGAGCCPDDRPTTPSATAPNTVWPTGSGMRPPALLSPQSTHR